MSTITAADPSARQAVMQDADSSERPIRRLGSYIDPDTGQTHKIVKLPRPDGSAFVVDYRLSTLGDGRLLAHLAPDEPPENAGIVCDLYLAEETKSRCRLLTCEDLQRTRFLIPAQPSSQDGSSQPKVLLDTAGHLYRIRELVGERPLHELRWTRSCHPGQGEPFEVLTLRDVIARLEDYEPARAMTTEAVAEHREDDGLSTRRLSEEVERLGASRIVLNRGLRESVQRAVANGELSMSEIALRCGRFKPNGHGSIRGESSWLARRIGQLPEGGESDPCPWIDSDVLALIARRGLGTSPREVEVA
ncbi:MAG: hypothetical protein WAN93_10965 [Solirubrobacteraceae bacterium]